MSSGSKRPLPRGRNIVILLILVSVILGFSPFLEREIGEIEADLYSQFLDLANLPELVIFQENSLAPISSPVNPKPESTKSLLMIITAYSSTEDQTDSDPYITAAGTLVRDGIIASNLLPFGTKIKIPELYEDKIFVVEDRMSWKKGKYQIDIWFPTRELALEFGVKKTTVLILAD